MIKRFFDIANKAIDKITDFVYPERKNKIVIRTKENNVWQYYSESGKTTDPNKAKAYPSMVDAYFDWRDIKNKDSYWAPSFIVDKEVI